MPDTSGATTGTDVSNKGTANQGSSFLKVGDKVFATAEEAAAHIAELQKQSAEATAFKQRAEQAERVNAAMRDANDALQAVDYEKWAAAQRVLGMPEKEVQDWVQKWKASNAAAGGEGGTDDNGTGGDGTEEAGEGEPATSSARSRGTSRKIGLADLDPELARDLKVIAKRSIAASEDVAQRNEDRLVEALEKDSVVGPFWSQMTDKQQARLLKEVKGCKEVADQFAAEQRLTREHINAGKQAARNFVTELYGEPGTLSKGKGSPRTDSTNNDVMTLGESGSLFGGSVSVKDVESLDLSAPLPSPDTPEYGPQVGKLLATIAAGLDSGKLKPGRR